MIRWREDISKQALIIIDVQVGAFDGVFIPVIPNAEELISNIKKVILYFRKEKLPIIYIQDDGDIGGAFERGSKQWSIHQGIAPKEDDFIIDKKQPSAFKEPYLIALLERLGISSVCLCGLHSELCFKQTALDAYKKSYQVMIIEDGHSSINKDQVKYSEIVKQQNELFRSSGLKVVSTNHFFK